MQLYRKRSRYLETDEERALWSQVTQELMSDEEEATDDSGREVFVVRTVFWRSRELEELVHKLIQRGRQAKPTLATARRIGDSSHRMPTNRCPRHLISDFSETAEH